MSDHFKRLEEHLLSVQAPGQYTGGETNSIVKPFDSVRIRVALAFPDAYSVGMSSLGLRIVYHLFNRREDALAERFFAPMPDMEAVLRREGMPLLSLESGRPMEAFDAVAFSFQYESLATNAANMLDLSGIPAEAAARLETHPLVMAGGGGTAAAEPLAPVMDLILAGDGEEIVDPLVEALAALKKAGASRRDSILEIARTVPGAYAPGFYERRTGSSGFLIPHPTLGLPERIEPALTRDLDQAPFPTAPPVPCIEVPHDRIALEIMRGCPHSCRFCEAGWVRKPVRMRRPETLLDQALKTYQATGYEEISLLALSAGDYPWLPGTIKALRDSFEPLRVNVSLPSLRVTGDAEEIPTLIKAVRRSGLTLAPEASSRLRPVINKPILDEHLMAVVDRAWSEGWRLIKLYFMVGLPGELDEDLDEIRRLSDAVARLRGRHAASAGSVNVTVSPFVPRPHTPFQWEAQTRPEAVRAKFERIRTGKCVGSVKFKFHASDRSILEGMLARGDIRAGLAALRAFRAGARFDAWDDRFDWRIWSRAFEDEGISPAAWIHTPRDTKSDQPFEIIGAGPSREILLKEREKALSAISTPSCGEGQCRGFCGPKSAACGYMNSGKGPQGGAPAPLQNI